MRDVEPALVLPWLATTYAIIVAAVAFVTGMRVRADDNDRSRIMKARLWLALLTLVQLGSPFLPWQYGTLSTLWLILLLAATARGWRLALLAVPWLALAVNIPLDVSLETMKAHFAYVFFAQALIFAILAVAVYGWIRAPRRVPVFTSL